MRKLRSNGGSLLRSTGGRLNAGKGLVDKSELDITGVGTPVAGIDVFSMLFPDRFRLFILGRLVVGMLDVTGTDCCAIVAAGVTQNYCEIDASYW